MIGFDDKIENILEEENNSLINEIKKYEEAFN